MLFNQGFPVLKRFSAVCDFLNSQLTPTRSNGRVDVKGLVRFRVGIEAAGVGGSEGVVGGD